MIKGRWWGRTETPLRGGVMRKRTRVSLCRAASSTACGGAARGEGAQPRPLAPCAGGER